MTLRGIIAASSLAAILTCAKASSNTPSSFLGVPWEQWVALNTSVGGNLHFSRPVALPCFSSFDDESIQPDPAACSAVQENYTNAFFRAGHFGASMNSQWETCQSTGSGCILDATNPANPAAFRGQDCEIGNVSPVYIEVQAVEHIQSAYVFSRNTGVRLSVKNTGHDYEGRSSGRNTLSLWVSHFNADLITLDTEFVPDNCPSSYRAMTIGAGVQMHQVYDFADAHNVTVPGGFARTVGMGYYLGGGHSILSPVYGLAVDRVVQIKVATPDGQFRTVNECQDSDLFWALRGGGGNAFGVVTELTMRVEPQLTLQAAVVTFPGNSSNLPLWFELLVNKSLTWGKEGWGGVIAGSSLVYVNPLLSSSAARTSMQAAIDFATAQGGFGMLDELPSWNTFFNKYIVPAEAPVGPEAIVGSRLLSTSLFETEAGRASLLKAIENVLPHAMIYVVAGTPLLYPYTENATSVTPAWRNSLWHFNIAGGFLFNSTVQDRQAAYAQVDQYTQAFRDLTPGGGAYFNEGSVYEPDHEQSFWGPNYPRLLETKTKYDPDDLMHCWQCVGWRGPSDGLYECYVEV